MVQDTRLPHKVQEWARSQPSGAASERDADAIVMWLRAQRGSDYARKSADGLRRQVVKVIVQLQSAAQRAEWAIDAAPDDAIRKANGKGPGSSNGSKRPRDDGDAGEPSPGFNLLNASLRASMASVEAAPAADVEAPQADAVDASSDTPRQPAEAATAAVGDAPRGAPRPPARGERAGERRAERRQSNGGTDRRLAVVAAAAAVPPAARR